MFAICSSIRKSETKAARIKKPKGKRRSRREIDKAKFYYTEERAFGKGGEDEKVEKAFHRCL